MNKAILKSESPKRCEQIAKGECTILLSKTAPKLETPFKCYIYCTKERTQHKHIVAGKEYRKPTRDFLCKIPQKYGGKICFIEPPIVNEDYQQGILNGKVIGVFVCDYIDEYKYSVANYGGLDIDCQQLDDTCLTKHQIEEYANGKDLYGWYISQLKIYDTPKELGEFWKYGYENDYAAFMNAGGGVPMSFNANSYRITRPPQSRCYVEELEV